jgi:hypothetical protein
VADEADHGELLEGRIPPQRLDRFERAHAVVVQVGQHERRRLFPAGGEERLRAACRAHADTLRRGGLADAAPEHQVGDERDHAGHRRKSKRKRSGLTPAA